MENTPLLTTQRLTLSRFTLEDDQAMYDGWANSEAVCRNLFLQPGKTLEECRDNMRWLLEQYDAAEDFFQWAIRQNGYCIGRIGLSVNRRHFSGSVFYYLAENAWGKGYMSEALKGVIDFCFDGLGLNRVEADHFVENPASGRVMEKAGMRREGTARQLYCKNGVFHDVALYGVVREDRK